MVATRPCNRDRRRTIIGVCIFIVYLMFLFYFLFFAEAMGRGPKGEYRYNLTLLKEIKRFWNHIDIIGWKAFLLNVFGNVIAFVPFGFFFPMLMKKTKSILLTTLTGFCFSLLVESLQLCLRLGIFDVDDMLLNTIGTFVGAVVYAIAHRVWNKYRSVENE
ncbi:MAG: VanZ family protein [Lachnospiraceae bacterium]|nr:VanZ family protein [Lachnospiraceae bacterium]